MKTRAGREDDDDYSTPAAPLRKQTAKEGVRANRHRFDRDTFDFLRDDPYTMMYGRRIALYLMKHKWYYPRQEDSVDDNEEDLLDPNPSARGDYGIKVSIMTHTGKRRASLEKAWAYFEHVTLPRFIDFRDRGKEKKSFWIRVYRRFMKWDQRFERADPGESHKPTSLYSPIFTPIAQMGDFGLGTGLYFTTLRAMAILLFILGIINIPNMLYYSGPDYSDHQHGIDYMLKGSAICTKTEWVPCPDCKNSSLYENDPDRIAQSSFYENDEEITLVFALRNKCDGAIFLTARINFATLIFLVIGIVALKYYQKQWEIKFDEDEITARDFSLVIENPPGDAKDPDQWRRYFEHNFRAKVASVTIGIDNDLLVKTLVERREALRCLELALDPGTKLDVLTLARISSSIENRRNFFQALMAWFIPGIPEFFGRLTVFTSRVQGLAQQEYEVKNVFVTFAKETSKNKILQQFEIGDLVIRNNNVEHMINTGRGKLCFEDKVILKCRHPDEPLTIRWKDLNSRGDVRMIQMIITNLIASAGMYATALIIRMAYNQSNNALGPMSISISNLVYPEFAKWLTKFESHFSEGDKQTSLYFKIALFRWINTAVLITIITPFTATVQSGDGGLIPAISAIFVSELLSTNYIRLADPYGHFQRHVLAPRAQTQDGMNLQMQGSEVELAERYTDMTKMIFLAFWYAAIYPFGLFFCSFILSVKYFVDRFGLMRTWKRVPPLGNGISGFSRRYFFTTCIIGLGLISSFYWASFPWDNLCSSNERINSIYEGNWTAITCKSYTEKNVTVRFGDDRYDFCLQDMMRIPGAFPFVPKNQPSDKKWMTKAQENVTSAYGWTAVGVLALVGLSFLRGWSENIAELFFHKHDVNKKEADVTFYDKEADGSISSYVPMVESPLFSYPLLACDTDGIDSKLFGWTDPDRPHAYYDLTKDCEFLLQGIASPVNNYFSRIVYFPKFPPKKVNQDLDHISDSGYD